MKRRGIDWLKDKRVRWLAILAILAIVAGLIAVGAQGVSFKPPRAKSGPMAIKARQLVLDSANPERTELGELHFLGAWELTTESRSFGGISALQMNAEGQFIGLNDNGVAFTFPQPGAPGVGVIRQLPMIGRKGAVKQGRPMDSESMAIDPATHKIFVGYELLQRICRFSPGFGTMEKCRDWPEMADWPITASLESMARLPDGRFIVISEGKLSKANGREALLFAGDPTADETPPPIPMTYVPPKGYDPTDAVWIGPDRMLVLNRRATIYDGFTAIITLVDIGGMKKGAVLEGREVARLAPPVLADNFEGLALEEKEGRRILWVVSDDNFLFFQRTLLLKFALPRNF